MTPRKIVRRTRGTRDGEITRLMSSSDVGQTSVAAPRAGEKRLKEIQRQLQRQGRL